MYRERQERCKMPVPAAYGLPADVVALSHLAQDSSFTEVSLYRVSQSKCIQLCPLSKCPVKHMNSAVHKEEFV